MNMHHRKLLVKIGSNVSEVGIADGDYTTTTCGSIKHNSTSYFQMFKCHEEISQGRKMGAE